MLLPHILQLPFWQQQKAAHVEETGMSWHRQIDWLVDGLLLLTDLYFFLFFFNLLCSVRSFQSHLGPEKIAQGMESV